MIDVSLIEQVKTHLAKLSAETGVTVMFECSIWVDRPEDSWRSVRERFEIRCEGYQKIAPATFTEIMQITAQDLKPKKEDVNE